MRGWPVDRDKLREFLARDEARLAEMDATLAGYMPDVNLDSPLQLGSALVKLGIVDARRMASHPEIIKTGADILEDHKDDHPAVPLLLERGSLTAMISTFYRPLLAASAHDGLAHPGYNWGGKTWDGEASGTETARWSSGKPGVNLMNPPKDLREAFVSRYGWMTCPDSRQVEYRIAYAMGNDRNMIELIRQGFDPHGAAAKLVGLPRSDAKNVNYANLFGAGQRKLVIMGVDPARVALIKETIMNATPGLRRWIAERKLEAITQGKVKGLFAMSFMLPDAQLPADTEENRKKRAHALRNAVNSPIQNANGLMTMWAMAQVEDEFRSRRMRAIVTGQLHDYISTEHPREEEEEVQAIMREVMVDRCQRLCQPWLRDVPLDIEFTSGPHMKGVKEESR